MLLNKQNPIVLWKLHYNLNNNFAFNALSIVGWLALALASSLAVLTASQCCSRVTMPRVRVQTRVRVKSKASRIHSESCDTPRRICCVGYLRSYGNYVNNPHSKSAYRGFQNGSVKWIKSAFTLSLQAWSSDAVNQNCSRLLWENLFRAAACFIV